MVEQFKSFKHILLLSNKKVIKKITYIENWEKPLVHPNNNKEN